MTRRFWWSALITALMLYEIEGVRFNMGGWWEFKLAINAPSGSDIVTFNLAL